MIPPIYKAKEERYDKMQYRFVGKSGLKFPAVSLGFWHNFGSIGRYETMKEIEKQMQAAGFDQVMGEAQRQLDEYLANTQ